MVSQSDSDVNSNSALPTRVSLRSRKDWFAWFTHLRCLSDSHWELVDPDGPDFDFSTIDYPKFPDRDSLREKLIAKRNEEYIQKLTQWSNIPDVDRSKTPPAAPGELTTGDESEWYRSERIFWEVECTWVSVNRRHYDRIKRWIFDSVPGSVLQPAINKAVSEGNCSAQNLVRKLKQLYAPSPSVMKALERQVEVEWEEARRRHFREEIEETARCLQIEREGSGGGDRRYIR
ncbi:hypothetical protein F4774DRAFT_207146 [Daldinia eschscholtzii]|nr:hypothetical protein F4774DRAFT_207146 [Daldinia eschscholtzii]